MALDQIKNLVREKKPSRWMVLKNSNVKALLARAYFFRLTFRLRLFFAVSFLGASFFFCGMM
jgi:hypothetical protein